MLVVTHKITIGTNTYKSPDSTSLKEVVVHNAIGIPVSSAEVTLSPGVDASCKAGDAVSIELGADGKTEKVFTGQVKAVEKSLKGVTVTAASAMEALTRTYVNTLFDSKSCGDIFKELARLSDAKTGKADDGLTFPRYIISSKKSVWRHIELLSRYCGTDVYTGPDDKFNFVQYKKSSGSTFTYGEDLLEAEKEEVTPGIDGVEVYGDSPAGQGQSDEANFWFKKEEVTGTAGKTSGVVQRLAVYAARNKDLCGKIATNLFEATKIKATGRALVLGGEKVAPGQTVTLKSVPEKNVNGDYKVTGVRHTLNGRSGFTTEITWEERDG